ncbi:tetratricopeptide repeat protein [Cellulosilyticum ruminicola]|uniref:tetratricopeptide repeat protein n=1 Tax=Cellulosilyticum ruminicola TaxID=425254 RepID=UPI0006CFB3B7|nr:tetratricopeptide repeat protein [Cellulosilyticum ruminicola]
MEDSIISRDFLPQIYFKKSLDFTCNGNTEEAIQSMDTAIIISDNAPFYIYQKMKLLYTLNLTERCSQFIITQLEYLFKNASLYLVCRFIDYYQKIHDLDLARLTLLLESIHLPYCLALEYKDLLYHPRKSLTHLAQKASIQDHHKLCISYCELIHKTKVFSPDIIYLKAYSYHMLGNLIKARLTYMEFIALEPENALAYHNLGLILMEQAQYLEAQKALEKANELAPNNKHYLMDLAECHTRFKHYEEAIAIYKSLHKAFPDDLQTYFNLSYIYKKHHRYFLYYKYTYHAKKKLRALL